MKEKSTLEVIQEYQKKQIDSLNDILFSQGLYLTEDAIVKEIPLEIIDSFGINE